jgi:hypothetical protein
LPEDEATVIEAIPVTTAARAVLDLAAEKEEAAAEAALREMEYLGIYGPVSLPVLLDRYPRHKGTPIVGVCLERLHDDPGGRVRSTLEELFLPFLDEHRIPRPRLNAWLSVGDHRYQVDCLWTQARLVGELDGFKSHGTKRAPQGPHPRSPPYGQSLPHHPDHRRPTPRRTLRAGRGPPHPSCRRRVMPPSIADLPASASAIEGGVPSSNRSRRKLAVYNRP